MDPGTDFVPTNPERVSFIRTIGCDRFVSPVAYLVEFCWLSSSI